ncbi:MAG: carboxypeptidase-like regulatory domain-containing protein [Planctomycetota bacterium]
MKKRNIKILVAAVILVAVCGWGIYIFYHPRIGSRSGRVVDATTGKPVEGAVVNYVWEFGGFLEVVGESLAAFCETLTDKEGTYFVPNRRARRKALVAGVLKPESVVIYKYGYAAYRVSGYGKRAVGRSFGYPGEHQKYHKKNNLVKLYPWKNAASHQRHIDCVKWSRNYMRSVLLRKELEREKERARQEAPSGN